MMRSGDVMMMINCCLLTKLSKVLKVAGLPGTERVFIYGLSYP